MRDASLDAVAWWRAREVGNLRGRPFAGLFFFEAPGEGADASLAAWQLLEAGASSGPMTLQARVDGGGFEAVVHLIACADGAARDVAYTARIERTDLAPARSAPQEKAPDLSAVSTDGPAPARASAAAVPPAGSESASITADERPPAGLNEFESGPFDDPTPPGEEEPSELGDDDAYFSDDDDDAASRGEDDDDDNASEDADETEPEETDRDARDDEADAVTRDLRGGNNLERAVVPGDIANWVGWEDGNVGFFELDFRFGTGRYSAAWCRLLDYDTDDVAREADTLGALCHPDDSEAAPAADQRGRRGTRAPFSAEARLRTKDGSWRWMQLEGIQTFGDDGLLAHVTGVMLDVQDRHDLEEEMGAAEARFRQLLGITRHGFFELDLEADNGTFANEFCHALGYAARELPATPDGFLRLLPPEDAEPGIASYFSALAGSGAGLTRRMQLRHRDGREVEFDVLLAVQRNRRQEVHRVLGLIAPASGGDEPDRHTAQNAGQGNAPSTAASATDKLAEAARLALDAVGEAVVLTDATGCIAHANVRAISWTGGDPEKILGKPLHEIFALVDRTNGVAAPEVVRRVLEGGHALELDHRYALIDVAGDRAEVVITCRALHDVRKRVCGGIVILRKPAEMPLTPAELVASNRMETLGRLACGIAHDFNNILTTVTGSISVAQDKRDWDTLAPAQKALGTARNLARQLLTFARGDSAEKKVQSINDVIKETARLTAAGSRSSVTLELGADVYAVNLDPVRLIQVFTNLILNAMQVMPAGGRVWVRTQNMRLGQVNSVALSAGDYVRVEVQDNGPGIPAENLEHIFEPFFSTRSGGTGLGLAMVRSIITQHEGAIEVASTLGTGTTFTLYFPRALTNPVKEISKPMAVTYGTGRVLIMDDDADLCMVAKGMLEVLGYDADTATSAEAALAAVRKFREMGRRYSAVILDLTMAGGPGGEDVLPQLREIDPEIVAIVSSGYATDDHLERYRKIGFKGMLAKPYRSADLGRALKEVLGAGK